jgi:hypothetical protein
MINVHSIVFSLAPPGGSTYIFPQSRISWDREKRPWQIGKRVGNRHPISSRQISLNSPVPCLTLAPTYGYGGLWIIPIHPYHQSRLFLFLHDSNSFWCMGSYRFSTSLLLYTYLLWFLPKSQTFIFRTPEPPKPYSPTPTPPTLSLTLRHTERLHEGSTSITTQPKRVISSVAPQTPWRN